METRKVLAVVMVMAAASMFPIADLKDGGQALFASEVGGKNERELEANAAGLFGERSGVDIGPEPKGDDADGGFPGFVFGGGNSNIEIDKLKRLDFLAEFSERKIGGAFYDLEDRRADPRQRLFGVRDALMDFGKGLGNKFSEVHG